MLGAIQNKEANNTSILSSKLHQMDLSSNLLTTVFIHNLIKNQIYTTKKNTKEFEQYYSIKRQIVWYNTSILGLNLHQMDFSSNLLTTIFICNSIKN